MPRLTFAGRAAAMIACGVIALLAIFQSCASYLLLDEGRAYMRNNAAHFRAAGNFVMDFRAAHHRFPADAELRQWAYKRGHDEWAQGLRGSPVGGDSVACTKAQPEDGFRLPASDTYIFAKWRGEWFDCYSLPSGTNNVIHDLPGDDLRGHVVLWTLAALMLLIGWGVGPFRGRRKQAVTDAHRAA